MKILLTSALVLILQNQSFAAVNCKDESSFPIISNAELNKVAKDKSAIIVDVNGNDSFKKNKVDGAIHFTNKQDLLKLLPADKNKMIVAYCGGPMCTAWHKAAQAACEAGYTNILHFKDGISGWKKI